MTEAEAKAKEGKKVRTLDGSHGVPKGTTGTVINARLLGATGATASGGSLPNMGEEWVVDVQFDDPAKTVEEVISELDESSLQPS